MFNTKFFILFCVIFAIILLQDKPLSAQQHLQQEIIFEPSRELSIREALRQLEEGNDFFFSYPSTVIAVDDPAPLDHYSGTIKGFLTLALGTAYEFKEIPGHIIIRYAPKMLDVDAEIEKTERQTTVKGYIRDHQSQESVAFASIYERSQLVSALSNQEGYFELKLKNSQSSIWVTLSKENYRDTSFILLPTVDIASRNFKSRLRFSPQSTNAGEVEDSFFGRFFIGFRQRIQRINLEGFFGESPYQVSFIPGIGSQGMFGSQMVNRFSLNLIGGYSAGTEGFETAGVFNINQQDTKGLQVAGLANMVGGSMQGMQVAGLYNTVYQKVEGFQVAGLYNLAKSGARGLQVAGLYNRSDSTTGHQIAGLINKAEIAEGSQMAGLLNLSPGNGGIIQMAGLMNYSGGSVESQIAGLLNHASQVNRFQIGIINIAESSDHPIGLLNLVKNGRKSVSLAMDESAAMQLTLRTGGRKLYGILGLAYLLGNTHTQFGYDLGFGIMMLDRGTFSLDAEWVNRVGTDFRTHSDITNSFRLLPAYRLSPGTKVFFGPSFNFAVLDFSPEKSVPGLVLADYRTDINIYGLFGGLIGGIQVAF
ncbi:peptidase associated/transthyretin-like domain-containing protein [Pleomorphovibrio marinus]|uniref:hypothetical protein n=1 Tax=Pleomorphovibrio marinus TaxID=2164132 RepID=UPI000E0C0AB4|nr:hypothetical protein [Pleomorphovibrio marinus]